MFLIQKMTMIIGAGLAFIMGGVAQDDRQDAEIMLERSFEVAAGGALRVDVNDGDVAVTTHGGSGVEVEIWATGRDMDWAREVYERMNFSVTASSGVVTITAEDARISRNEWGRNRGVGIGVRVSIPERFNLDIETSDGDVSIEDVQGSVSLNSSDGDITLMDVVGPELRVRTSDGDVRVGNTRTEVLDVRSSDGDITVAGAIGSVQLKTSDGDIDAARLSGSITLETSDGDIVAGFADITDFLATTHDGDIVMYAPQELSADVMLEGEDLSLDREMVVQGTVSRRRISGQINGGGPSIRARSGDGSITLRRSSRASRN
jgi:DUF4097 and DUF4098 domain-containing protein YvlB